MKILKMILNDTRGSMLHFIATIIIIFVGIGVYNLSISVIYRDRAVIRDAIDSAVISSLAGATSEHTKATNYYEGRVCVEESEPDKDGNTHCIEHEWVARQNNNKNYIYVNKSTADSIAKEYFNKIIDEKGLKVQIVNWNYNIVYDSDHYVSVTKNRSHTGNPPNWWLGELGDTNPNDWGGSSYESKNVRFPRWVKASLTARVKVNVPMGKILGKEYFDIQWTSKALKELNIVK